MMIEGLMITWLGHASFKIVSKDGHVIYIDPFQLENIQQADLVIVTHGHYDHLSIPDMKRIVTSKTTVVCPSDCISKINGNLEPKDIVPFAPMAENNVLGMKIKAVPAYNTNKVFHPKDNDWLGYVVTLSGKTVYHAGDTDLIPEMEHLGTVDIALLPVSGTYVMSAKEAASACKKIKPKIAIPMHYGSIVGNEDNAVEFEKLVNPQGIQVIILKKE